jgi:hypothetical protein
MMFQMELSRFGVFGVLSWRAGTAMEPCMDMGVNHRSALGWRMVHQGLCITRM